jgi:hypothetical protein
MLKEADEIQTYQEVRGTAAWSLAKEVHHLFHGAGPLAAVAPGQRGFKVGRAPWDGEIPSGIICGAYVDHGPHLSVGLTEHLPLTRLCVRDPLHVAVSWGRCKALEGELVRKCVNKCFWSF